MVDYVSTTSGCFPVLHQERHRRANLLLSRYRYMLEAFVDKVQGRGPQTWVSAEDTIANMKAIELFYENVRRSSHI